MRPDFQTLDELTRKLAASLPDGVKAARSDIEQRFRTILESTLSRMDIVTREEFEIHRRVLERSREKLEQLEQRLAELERPAGE